MINNVSQNKLCFGCRACEQVCNRGAITMSYDEEGFLRPSLNVAQCVNCGLCLKVCPTVHSEEIKHVNKKVYAAQAKDEKVLFKSSAPSAAVTLISHRV